MILQTLAGLLVALPLNGLFAEDSSRPPNILFLMVDDLGYADLGCYGSEIRTPHLDQLAENGLRLSQFYNTAKCHSSRVSLLTGQYCLAAGDVSLSHAVTSAEVLREAGYFTAMTGKWHLRQQPTDFGFERYFGHLSGACNYFRGDQTFRLNGEPWQVPPTGFYTTTANVDWGLTFLNEARRTDKPWFLYIAFNAPHAPLHALPEDYARYAGRYEVGWDVIRDARIARQKQTGLLPPDLPPSPRPEHVPAWSQLTAARRAFESRRMQTLAAMIDRVDQEIGRLVQDLKAQGELDNTLIWFVSDNGACPYDRRSTGLDKDPVTADVTYGDSTGWAWARNAPFRYYKQNQYEGGISSPAVIHWPAGLSTPAGTVIDQPAHLIDVLPTLADIIGTRVPQSWPGRDVRPVSGQSLKPLFDARSLQRQQPLHLLFSTDRGLRDGDWKAVSFRGESWELYNLKSDRAENVNLAGQHPQRLQEMVERWTTMARDVLHAPAKAWSPPRPAQLPHQHPEWTRFDRDPVDGDQRRSRGKKSGPTATTGLRARKNTKLQREGNVLQLTFSGEDPGLAIDRLPSGLPPGPYVLTFELASRSQGRGDVFYTEKPGVPLPQGQRLPLAVRHDGVARRMRVAIPAGRICKLRLDVCGDAQGTATIRDLTLQRPDGTRLLSWPADIAPAAAR